MSNEITVVETAQPIANNSIIFSTIKGGTVADNIRIANAINSPDSLAEVNSGEIINVVDIICSHGIRKGRNNMPDTPCINTVFLLEDGNAVFTQSDGVARSVSTIATLFPDCGKSQGMEYLPLFIEEKQLKNGNTLKVVKVYQG